MPWVPSSFPPQRSVDRQEDNFAMKTIQFHTLRIIRAHLPRLNLLTNKSSKMLVGDTTIRFLLPFATSVEVASIVYAY